MKGIQLNREVLIKKYPSGGYYVYSPPHAFTRRTLIATSLFAVSRNQYLMPDTYISQMKLMHSSLTAYFFFRFFIQCIPLLKLELGLPFFIKHFVILYLCYKL
jgi:hypothetical protein